MAGRKDKNTVDYFPHYVNHGKTLFIIESKFGNDGYAAWFKILETLGSSEHHYIDCRNEADWEFLNAKIKLMHTSLQDVLDLCAKLGAINQKLWENRVIFSENFVKNIEDAYTRRSSNCPTLHDIVNIIGIDVNINAINDDTNTQSKVKKSKVSPANAGGDFIEQVYGVFKKQYHQHRGTQYVEATRGKDRSAIGKIVAAIKGRNANKDKDTQQMLHAMDKFFDHAIAFDDSFLQENMTPPTILMKINTLLSGVKKKSYNPHEHVM